MREFEISTPTVVWGSRLRNLGCSTDQGLLVRSRRGQLALWGPLPAAASERETMHETEGIIDSYSSDVQDDIRTCW